MRDAQLDDILKQSRINWEKIAFYLYPRPYSGRIWLDMIYLLLIAALEQAVFPKGLFGYIPVDLVGPWLIASIILQPFYGAIIQVLIGAWFLETSTVAPAGMYLCAYLVFTIVIHLVRNSLSWRHRVPWAVTVSLAMLWIVVFEAFVIAVTRNPQQLGFEYCLSQFARLAISTGIGYLLALDWIRSRHLEENSG